MCSLARSWTPGLPQPCWVLVGARRGIATGPSKEEAPRCILGALGLCCTLSSGTARLASGTWSRCRAVMSDTTSPEDAVCCPGQLGEWSARLSTAAPVSWARLGACPKAQHGQPRLTETHLTRRAALGQVGHREALAAGKTQLGQATKAVSCAPSARTLPCPAPVGL